MKHRKGNFKKKLSGEKEEEEKVGIRIRRTIGELKNCGQKYKYFRNFNLQQVDACLNSISPLGSIGSSLGWSPPEGNSIWGKANPIAKNRLTKDVNCENKIKI